jgi:hypothetical protein
VFEFATPTTVPARAVAHPYLAPAAAVAATWNGDVALHGGAFVSDGNAWIVLGGTGSGKSTLLATLAAKGVPILTDDLAVIRGGAVTMGPRCVDLRGDVARSLGVGEALGVIGARERWRLSLPPVAGETRLAGFVELAWGLDGRHHAVAAPARLATIASHRAVVTADGDHERLLDLTELPMVRVDRRRDLGGLDDGVALVLGAL